MPRKPGPRPVSAEVIELRGNPSKLGKAAIEERRESTPKPEPLAPKAPAELSPLARECWEHHAPELEHLGLLTRLDRGAFLFACECYALAVSALEEMRPKTKAGAPRQRGWRTYQVTTADPAHGQMLKRHPAFLVWRQAQQDYRAWCVEFGLTPSSRVGLRPKATIPAGAGDDGDDLDDDADFFGTG